MKLIRWFASLFRSRKKVYLVQFPVGFQLSEHLRDALFGKEVKYE